MSPDSTTNFVGFPNKLFDTFIYRDERMLNLTSLTQSMIVINALSPDLVSEYNRKDIYVRLTVSDSDVALKQEFNVTFLDRYNTNIYPLSSDDSQEIKNLSVFYNCG